MPIKEMYLSEFYQTQNDSEQMSFASFGSDSENVGTTIAVVSDPVGGIVEETDEFYPELGMPLSTLQKFQSLKKKYETQDDVSDIEAHNNAAKECELKKIYETHLSENESAQESVCELATRSINGETITVICFEKDEKWCHRHVLKQHIEEKQQELEK